MISLKKISYHFKINNKFKTKKMKKNLLLFAIFFICLLSKAATNKNNQVNYKNPFFESIILKKYIFKPLKNPTIFYYKTLITCSVTVGGSVSNGNTSIS